MRSLFKNKGKKVSLGQLSRLRQGLESPGIGQECRRISHLFARVEKGVSRNTTKDRSGHTTAISYDRHKLHGRSNTHQHQCMQTYPLYKQIRRTPRYLFVNNA